jgi:protein subunit release factor B
MLNYITRNNLSSVFRLNFSFLFFSSTKKNQQVRLYLEEDIQEVFVRGSGSGGQSVAKTSNCVQLLHVPTGIRVRCHKTRSRDLNRKEARRLLQLELEDRAFGSNSKRAIKEAKRKKNKSRSYAKSKAKHKRNGEETLKRMSGKSKNTTRGRTTKRRLLHLKGKFRKFMVSMSKLWFGVERRNWVQSRIRKDENDE